MMCYIDVHIDAPMSHTVVEFCLWYMIIHMCDIKTDARNIKLNISILVEYTMSLLNCFPLTANAAAMLYST